MDKTDLNTSRPPGITRIYEAASKLVKPSLAPLYQVFLDEKAAVERARASLRHQQEEVRQEGFDAAVRLMVEGSDRFRIEQSPYFERIAQGRAE